MDVHVTKIVCEIENVLYETSCDRGSVHVGIFHDKEELPVERVLRVLRVYALNR